MGIVNRDKTVREHWEKNSIPIGEHHHDHADNSMLTERTLHIWEFAAGEKRTFLADVTPEQSNGLPVKDIC